MPLIPAEHLPIILRVLDGTRETHMIKQTEKFYQRSENYLFIQFKVEREQLRGQIQFNN